MSTVEQNSTSRDGDILQVQVISLVYVCNALFSSLPFIGPAFDTALHDIKMAYPNLNFTHQLVGNNAFDCRVDNFMADSDDMLAKYYFSRAQIGATRYDLTAFVTPGTPGDGLGVARLATEENKLLITSGSSNPFPAYFPGWIDTNVMSLGAYTLTFQNILRIFNWTDISTITDVGPGQNPIFDAVIFVLRKRLEASKNMNFRLTEFKFNSKLFTDEDYDELLNKVRGLSRVILYFSVAVTLQLQYRAHLLNMTNGEYVFIALAPFRVPSRESPSKWFENDPSGYETNLAFKCLIRIENTIEPTANVTGLFARWKELSRIKYNFKYPPADPVPPYVASTYGAMMALAEVTNEIHRYGPRDAFSSGQKFANMFANRTFALKTGKLKLGEHGQCIPYLAVTQLNVITDEVTIIMLQDAETGELRMINPTDWPSIWPVLNEPKCGFIGQSSKCQTTGFRHVSNFESVVPVGRSNGVFLPLTGFQMAHEFVSSISILMTAFRCTVGANLAAIYGASVGTTVVIMAIVIILGFRLARFRNLERSWWELKENYLILVTVGYASVLGLYVPVPYT